ncbi:MAG: hypothetical protein A3A77_00590 [Candidatus Blackburnbacteria bacterium RIFCSPLOWO2_01_FULL_40_20]|uniref:FAD/NAD(P)-binding domain-containing protein n=1 Tax=Candidatus Blackburnbacteria bacterium RIFCSPLOWO2_01_FULL_40_20 TaxID=1797519 RepID=A0A1G1VAI2_9BACT|nr:MAG: hypothetical protein A3A77_00590 [Candidatus Blackburnbacteria bacterium RIFCSPLOWO2_01_FULL_40_20]
MSPKILVLGGGFAGVRAALDLSKLLPNGDITLISKSSYHCFVPDLYEIATAIIKNEHRADFKNLRGTVNIPLDEIFGKTKVKVIIDEIKNIDLVRQVVNTTKENLEYNYLVICLGSTTNYKNIEGAQNFSHPFKTTEDALNIRNDIDELVSKSPRPIEVVIAGGGFTGCELSAELSGFLSKLSTTHKKGLGKIAVLQSKDAILSGMSKWAQDEALKRLKKLKVIILTNHKIQKITQAEIVCENQERLTFDYLIWTTGIKSAFTNINGIKLNNRGQIKVSKTLNIENFPDVFAVGDIAEFWDEKGNALVPQTAWVAIGQAKIAARNIASSYNNLKLKKYSPLSPVFIVPVGQKFAISNMFGLNTKGLFVWFARRLVSLKYLTSVLSPNKALLLWLQGARIYIKNDT